MPVPAALFTWPQPSLYSRWQEQHPPARPPGLPPVQSINELSPDGGFLMRLKPNVTLEEAKAICDELAGATSDGAARFRGACTGEFNSVSGGGCWRGNASLQSCCADAGVAAVLCPPS